MFSLRSEPKWFGNWFGENKGWIRKQYESENGAVVPQVRECGDCAGKGTVPCDHCGGPDECNNCEGSGKILMEESEIFEAYAKKLWVKQVEEDTKKFEAYVKAQVDGK